MGGTGPARTNPTLNIAPITASPRGPAIAPQLGQFRTTRGSHVFGLSPRISPVYADPSQSGKEVLILPPLNLSGQNNFEVLDPFSSFGFEVWLEAQSFQADPQIASQVRREGSGSEFYVPLSLRDPDLNPKLLVMELQLKSLLWQVALKAYPKNSPPNFRDKLLTRLSEDYTLISAFVGRKISSWTGKLDHPRTKVEFLFLKEIISSWKVGESGRVQDLSQTLRSIDRSFQNSMTSLDSSSRGRAEFRLPTLFGVTTSRSEDLYGERPSDDLVGTPPERDGVEDHGKRRHDPIGDEVEPDEVSEPGEEEGFEFGILDWFKSRNQKLEEAGNWDELARKAREGDTDAEERLKRNVLETSRIGDEKRIDILLGLIERDPSVLVALRDIPKIIVRLLSRVDSSFREKIKELAQSGNESAIDLVKALIELDQISDTDRVQMIIILVEYDLNQFSDYIDELFKLALSGNEVVIEFIKEQISIRSEIGFIFIPQILNQKAFDIYSTPNGSISETATEFWIEIFIEIAGIEGNTTQAIKLIYHFAYEPPHGDSAKALLVDQIANEGPYFRVVMERFKTVPTMFLVVYLNPYPRMVDKLIGLAQNGDADARIILERMRDDSRASAYGLDRRISEALAPPRPAPRPEARPPLRPGPVRQSSGQALNQPVPFTNADQFSLERDNPLATNTGVRYMILRDPATGEQELIVGGDDHRDMFQAGHQIVSAGYGRLRDDGSIEINGISGNFPFMPDEPMRDFEAGYPAAEAPVGTNEAERFMEDELGLDVEVILMPIRRRI